MIYVTLNVTWLLGPDEPPQLPYLNPIIATLGFSETEDLYHRFTADKSVATVEKLLKKWAKISEECFRPLVQSMQQVLKPVTFAYNPLSLLFQSPNIH